MQLHFEDLVCFLTSLIVAHTALLRRALCSGFVSYGPLVAFLALVVDQLILISIFDFPINRKDQRPF